MQMAAYFDKYTTQKGEFTPQSDKVKALFKDIFIPSAADWDKLKQAVMKDGLYHQNRLAVAPNGSIFYINDTTASLHPIINRIEERQEKKIGNIYYPALICPTKRCLIINPPTILICEKSLTFMRLLSNTLIKV